MTTKGDSLGSRVGFSMTFSGFGQPVGSRFFTFFLVFSWFGVINFEGQF